MKQSTCERVSRYLWCLHPYLQLFLLFFTLPLALGQSGSVLLFHHHSSLCFQGMKLGLSRQFCYLAVGAQLQLLKPAQVISLLDRQLRWGRHGCISSWWQRGRSHHQQHSDSSTPTNRKILNLEQSRNAEIASVKEVLFRGTSSLFYSDASTQLCQMHISQYDAHICVGGTVCRYQTDNVETEAANVLMNATCPTVQTPEFYSSKCLKRFPKLLLLLSLQAVISL